MFGLKLSVRGHQHVFQLEIPELQAFHGKIDINDRVRISQVRQRLVSSCQVSVSSCPAQTQEAQYAQKKYSQSCIFKAHIITS